SHGGVVGPKEGTDILQVNHYGVELFQNIFRRATGGISGAVNTVNRNTGCGISRIVYVGSVERSHRFVLRREQRDEFDAVCMSEQVVRATTTEVEAYRIGEQPNSRRRAIAFQLREAVRLKDVNASQNLAIAFDRTARTGQTFVVSGDG